jgi:S-DNA-T family DNA segregation ATPase FtsK/SpoIIIE
LNCFIGREIQRWIDKIIGIGLLIVSISGGTGIFFEDPATRFRLSGFFGISISNILVSLTGGIGAPIILISLGILSIVLITEVLIAGSFVKAKDWWRLRLLRQEFVLPAQKKIRITGVRSAPTLPFISTNKQREFHFKSKPKQDRQSISVVEPVDKNIPSTSVDYSFPSIDLFNIPPPVEQRKIEEDLKKSAQVLEDTLKDFSVETKVVQVDRGPVITLYQIQPASGVKVSRIVQLSDDIALNMKAESVRIVAPIPGKSTVGVEVPNTQSTLVYLRDILESPEFKDTQGTLPLVLGKDIAGRPVVSDLTDMPHLLIAGTTGSGKTVAINSIISSLIFKIHPDNLKLLLVDPKMVEMAVYNNIPHLLCPVLTDAKKTSMALGWLVQEMEKRFRLFSHIGARDIRMYNEKINSNKTLSEVEFSYEHKRMPFIVVVVDELADLMMVARDDVESAIQRLTQLSRAVGIHLVVATQRPSVDVITGVIKANCPARVSFQVSSKVDSRTVLDMNGAEKLLGKGDLLFLRPGTSKPIRAQGALVSDEEVQRLADFIKTQKQPLYDPELLNAIKIEKQSQGGSVADDELYDDALQIVLSTGMASASVLQRKMRLSYQRAARLIDLMEERGIVGPYRGSKPREILVDIEHIKKRGEDENIGSENQG